MWWGCSLRWARTCGVVGYLEKEGQVVMTALWQAGKSIFFSGCWEKGLGKGLRAVVGEEGYPTQSLALPVKYL